MKKIAFAAFLAASFAFAGYGIMLISANHAYASNAGGCDSCNNKGDAQNDVDPESTGTNGNASGDSNHYGGYGDTQNATSDTRGKERGDYHN